MSEVHNTFALSFENNRLYSSLFSIIKWIIVVMKYGFENQIKNKVTTRIKNVSTSQYNYNLELVTITKKIKKVSNLHVIMEGDNESEMSIKLSYCGQDCQKIPSALWNMYGSKAQYLDLSYNHIESLKGLENFTKLQELILDNNKLEDNIRLPFLPYLRTLSLNNNKLTDLDGLIEKICDSLPALSYLSLLSNKACPNQLSDSDKDDSDYQRYRYFVIYKIRNLRFLDSRRVSAHERAEAITRGEFTRVRRPPADAEQPPVNIYPLVRPMPVDLASLGKHKGAYGKCRYKYTGKHSEGNRFIVNSDL